MWKKRVSKGGEDKEKFTRFLDFATNMQEPANNKVPIDCVVFYSFAYRGAISWSEVAERRNGIVTSVWMASEFAILNVCYLHLSFQQP